MDEHKRRFLEEVYETAQDLDRVGLISKGRMGNFEPSAASEKSNLSQAVFAAVLNTSASTVQKWEVATRNQVDRL